MSQLQPEMLIAVRELISHLTGFDEDEENFELCLDFATSNLLYHKHFDPEERTVYKWMDGLKEKLWVHVERDKANDLEILVERYKNAPVFKERHEQHDIQVRILSLLQHLSDSPLNVKWDGISQEELKEEEAKEVVDWRALLAEGEEEWKPGLRQDDDQLSEWSDENEEDDEHLEEQDQARSLPLPQPTLAEKKVTSEDDDSAEDPCERLAKMVQPQYWKTDRCDPHVTSTIPEIALFSYRVDDALRAAGVNTVAKKVLSEYQLLREIIWGLNVPVQNTVFEMDEKGQFSMRENVCLASVTASCLKNALQPIADMMTHLKTIYDFYQSVRIGRYKEPQPTDPLTYEAYGCSLFQLLRIFWLDLAVMEKKVAEQEVTFTLFTLFEGFGEWPYVWAELYHCHLGLVGRSEREEHSNWQKAILLISGLHRKITTCVHDHMHDIYVNLYLSTTRMYLTLIGIWLSQGKILDFRDELMFAHKTDDTVNVESETFWTEGIEVRDCRGFVESKGYELPEMWEDTLNEILVSGKSVEIMAVLEEKCLFREPHGTYRECRANSGLEILFVDHIRYNFSLLSKKIEKQPKNNFEAKEPLPKKVDNYLDADDLDLDPYLKLAFSEVCASAENLRKNTEPKPDFYVIKGVHSFLPVSLILTRCMKGLIYESYKKSCDALSKLILKTLDLQYHLGIIRKVFLMEAGDLLFEFYSNLFERLETGLDLDSTAVTMFLRDCLDRRFEEESDRFWISLPEEDKEKLSPEEFISKITLEYEVKWPLSIVLNSESLVVYNKIFLFLLEVKRASWSLRQIQAKELITQLRRAEAKQEREDYSSGEDGRMSPSLRVHRVLLLRSWLLHFVGNIHSYFMSRVLHSTELELRDALRECSDLDQILHAHTSHLNRISDRCFLHSSANVLREAVLKVFSVCHRLTKLCNSGIATASENFEERLTVCERDYSRSHQFLSSTLTSMTQRRNVPHLDGLAAALAHSCPGEVD